MQISVDGDITVLLRKWRDGNSAAGDRIVQQLYPQLKIIARKALSRNRPVSLQPTEMVNELFIKLQNIRQPDWEDRTHFFGIASRLIRNILVDLARRRGSLKRGGGLTRVELGTCPDLFDQPNVDLLDLDRALTRLAVADPEAVRCTELRHFGGLEINETAMLLDMSPSKVVRKWRFAKAWLRRELTAGHV